MKQVIIAEKPSVARHIADALHVTKKQEGYFEGENYLVTWVFGHLLELYEAKDYDESMKSWRLEKFPFIPDAFKYKIKVNPKNKKTDSGVKKQITIIKQLIKRDDVEGVISATDYDREGQVIADELFLYLKLKKTIYRLLLNEWTAEEIHRGMQNLKLNTELQSLQDAGMSRQIADWLIGINLTSVATVKYGGQLLNIGRVLLPTLKIIYDRDQEIAHFKSTRHYKLLAQFKTPRGDSFEATYYEEKNEKFKDKSVLEQLASLIKGQQGIVLEKKVEQKKEYAPPLFNLSNLQGYVTSKYKGFTSDKVLKVAQSLYEKKYITYPRTGSLALEESLKERTRKVVDTLKVGLPYEQHIQFSTSKRIFNNSKVESHSAICPTYIKPNKLTADEEIVYTTIKNRFLMQFMPIAEFEETTVMIKMENETIKGLFVAKGKVQLVEGWQVIEKPESKDKVLPLINQGEKVDVTQSTVKQVDTQPPKLHTEKTLLKVMETCGKKFKETKEETSEEMMVSILSGFSIGTPATRADTIRKLKEVGYIETKGKSLTCSELGKQIVEQFPVKALFDLEYTGRLEKTLSDIEKGKFQKVHFLEMIEAFVRESVEKIKLDDTQHLKTEKPVYKTASKKENKTESLGKCPLCGGDVIENTKAFGCSNWKNGCKYTIWKNDRVIESLGKRVTKPMVELLLKNGKVGFKNLKRKDGTTFAAYLYFEQDQQTGSLSWRLEPI